MVPAGSETAVLSRGRLWSGAPGLEWNGILHLIYKITGRRESQKILMDLAGF